jgi:hypothetical protein
MLNKALLSRLLGGRKSSSDGAPALIPATAGHPASPAQWSSEPWTPEHESAAAAQAAHEPSQHDQTAYDDATADQGTGSGIVAGHIEHLSAAGASGWAFDAARPDKPVGVAAFLGAACLGHAAADMVRDDLRHEIGDGAHGFNLAFSPPVPEGLLHQVYIVAAAAGIPAVLRAPEPAEIVAAVHPDATGCAPIFIIGVAPDAAAVLTRSLSQAMGLSGHGDGHLLSLSQSLIQATNQFYRNAMAAAGPHALVRQVKASRIHQAIRQMFATLMAEQHPQGDWIDNSQGLAGIQAAMAMRMIWPRARFIFLSSRVIESAGLRAEAEPSRGLKDHVGGWVREMQSWAETRDRFRNNSLSIDRLVLLSDPAEAAATIAKFLQLDDGVRARLSELLTQAVHDAGLSIAPLAADALAGWDGEEGQGLRAASEQAMVAFGYSWDSSYFAPAKTLESATP